MKKTLSKLAAIYFILSFIAFNSQVSSILLADAAIGDYPTVQCVSLTNDLIYGSTDSNTANQVTLLQIFLIQKGYEIGSDSFGTFGYGTKDAVAAFQSNNGLIPTGFVGSNTRVAIQNSSCNTNYSNLPATRQISNVPAQNCGVNNGWIWNGTQCVNTCDTAHPWNPNTQKCSTANDYYNGSYNNNIQNNPLLQSSCSAGYYWSGSSCSQSLINQGPSSQYTNATNNICSVYGSQYVWNGSVCVSSGTNVNTNPCNINTCNQNPCTNACNQNYTYTYPSTNINYTNSNNPNTVYVQNSNNLGNCSAYAPNYVWNGSFCVQPQNYSYCGTDTNIYWNGSACTQKYTTQYLCTTNGQYYTNQSSCPASNNTNNSGYVNVYSNCPNACVNNYDNYANSYNYLGGINYTTNTNPCTPCQQTSSCGSCQVTNPCSSCVVNNQNSNNVYYDNNQNNVVNTGYYDIYGNYHAN